MNRSNTRILLPAAAFALLVALPGVASADHPDRRQIERVQVIAHDLESASRYAHRVAESDFGRRDQGHYGGGHYDKGRYGRGYDRSGYDRYRRHGYGRDRLTREEAGALYALANLVESADHFHAQVERNRQNPSHTRDDYWELESAYAEASRRLERLHCDGRIIDAFYKVEELMGRLRWFYGGRDGRYQGAGDPYYYGDYDHDGSTCTDASHRHGYRRQGEYRRDGSYYRPRISVRIRF